MYTLRVPKISDTAIAVRQPNAHILVCNAILHLNEQGIPAEMADSRAGKGKVKMNPGTWCTRKYENAGKKDDGDM